VLATPGINDGFNLPQGLFANLISKCTKIAFVFLRVGGVSKQGARMGMTRKGATFSGLNCRKGITCEQFEFKQAFPRLLCGLNAQQRSRSTPGASFVGLVQGLRGETRVVARCQREKRKHVEQWVDKGSASTFRGLSQYLAQHEPETRYLGAHEDAGTRILRQHGICLKWVCSRRGLGACDRSSYPGKSHSQRLSSWSCHQWWAIRGCHGSHVQVAAHARRSFCTYPACCDLL
jgi:hypothetical protein